MADYHEVAFEQTHVAGSPAIGEEPPALANRLANATSTYLQQHADNTVDWWEWSEAAFAEAVRRDVPVFLSVGYAACHWCHEVPRLAAVDGNLRNRRSAA